MSLIAQIAVCYLVCGVIFALYLYVGWRKFPSYPRVPWWESAICLVMAVLFWLPVLIADVAFDLYERIVDRGSH